MLNKKIIIAAIAMLFSLNNAHAQILKKMMKAVQDVSNVVNDASKTDANNSNTTTNKSLNSSTTMPDDGSLAISLNAAGYEIKLLKGNHAGDIVTYEFLIINKTGKTHNVYVEKKEGMTGYDDYKTFATDDQYNVYEYEENMTVAIGGTKYGPFTLSANVPSKMVITLNKVATDVKKIPYLSVAFREMAENTPYGVALLQIKNLPVQ